MENNVKVKRAARAAGIPLWKLAAELGVSEPTITRWLRFPLSEEKEQKMLEAIHELDREVS